MADRYWVGGTGTWDGATKTNWSATSGGAGGASAPTSADNVFFNSLSNATAYTVTVTGTASCADMTMVGPLSGNVTWAGSGTLNIAGSITVAATGITRTYTGGITFSATTTGKIITVGVTLASIITFNGVGGSWTLGSAISCSTIVITAGTFDTSAAGNYSVTCSSFSCTSTSTSVLNLNASTVNLTSVSPITMTGSGFTLNAGTSQINITTSSGPTFSSSGKTFYNVSFTGAPLSTSFPIAISGVNTFNNLTFTSPSSTTIGAVPITFSATQTINGTLTGSGAAANRRLFYQSTTFGTARTLVLANPTTLSNVDFCDITAATSAITATTSGGDCGGNTNITFSTPKTVYWNLAGAQNWSATGWAASSGGSPAVANFPLAQDTAIFDNTGSVTGTITIGGTWNVGTVHMSGRTAAMTLAITAAPSIYGSWLNGTGVTLSGTVTISFAGRGNTQQIFGNGVAFPSSITMQNIGGTVQLTSAMTIGSIRSLNLANGTLDLQSYTLTTGIFNSFYTTTRVISFGTGNIIITNTSGGSSWSSNPSGLTTTGSRTVNVSITGATASNIDTGLLTTANALDFNITTGTYVLTFVASSRYRDINFTGFTGTVANSAITILGNLVLTAGATYSAGTATWTFAIGLAATYTITTNGVLVDWPLTFNGSGMTWALQDALTMGATRLLTHSLGTINLSGKTFTVGSSYITSGAGTKNITFNGGTLVCPAASTTAFNNAAPTGFTTTTGTGTGTISMTGATAKTFVGGGSTFNCTLNQGGAGALTITGANTFNNITNTVQPASVLFTAATTNTFSNFSLSGTAGNLITISSVTAATHTLSKASGTISSDYLSITNSIATGGASWYAGANSTNVSGNSGWIFTAPPAPGGNTGAFFSIL